MSNYREIDNALAAACQHYGKNADGFCFACGWGSPEATLKRRVKELAIRVDLLESGLRGEQGIEFDDGYAVNVAALKEQLNTALALLHTACMQPREFYLGQHAACIALGPEWYAKAQDLLIEANYGRREHESSELPAHE